MRDDVIVFQVLRKSGLVAALDTSRGLQFNETLCSIRTRSILGLHSLERTLAILLRFLFLVFALHSRFIFGPFAPDLRGTLTPHLRSIFHDFPLDPAIGWSKLRPIL